MLTIDVLDPENMALNTKFIQNEICRNGSFDYKIVWTPSIAPLHRFFIKVDFHTKSLGAFILLNKYFHPEYYVYVCSDYNYLVYDIREKIYVYNKTNFYNILKHNPEFICDDYLFFKNSNTIYGFQNGQNFLVQCVTSNNFSCEKRNKIIEIIDKWVQMCIPEYRQKQRNELIKAELFTSFYRQMVLFEN